MQYNILLRELEQLLRDNDLSNINTIDKLIKSHPYLNNDLFKNLRSPVWFNELLQRSYFDPINITFDCNGIAQYWIALEYLEKLSVIHDDNIQLPKVIDIIVDVVNYSINKRTINNPSIWWSIVKIINNLPLQIIIDHYPISGDNGFNQLINTIYTSVTNNDLPIQEAAKLLIPKFIKEGPSIPYAELIIDQITSFKPGKIKSLLTNRDESVMVWDGYEIIKTLKITYNILRTFKRR